MLINVRERNIKATNAKNRKAAGGKDLVIPVGNLVLLRDHPEGRNKIQDNNKRSNLYRNRTSR